MNAPIFRIRRFGLVQLNQESVSLSRREERQIAYQAVRFRGDPLEQLQEVRRHSLGFNIADAIRIVVDLERQALTGKYLGGDRIICCFRESNLTCLQAIAPSQQRLRDREVFDDQKTIEQRLAASSIAEALNLDQWSGLMLLKRCLRLLDSPGER